MKQKTVWGKLRKKVDSTLHRFNNLKRDVDELGEEIDPYHVL